jgi:hypothetical protein
MSTLRFFLAPAGRTGGVDDRYEGGERTLGLKSVERGHGLIGPAIYCHHCDKEIKDAKDGNFAFRVNEVTRSKDGARTYFTHKRCCEAFEAAHGGQGDWGTGELSWLPVYLCNVLGIDWERAKASVAELARAGL